MLNVLIGERKRIKEIVKRQKAEQNGNKLYIVSTLRAQLI